MVTHGLLFETRFRYLTEIQEVAFDRDGNETVLPPVQFDYGRVERRAVSMASSKVCASRITPR
jgi:hypothetical protein